MAKKKFHEVNVLCKKHNVSLLEAKVEYSTHARIGIHCSDCQKDVYPTYRNLSVGSCMCQCANKAILLEPAIATDQEFADKLDFLQIKNVDTLKAFNSKLHNSIEERLENIAEFSKTFKVGKKKNKTKDFSKEKLIEFLGQAKNSDEMRKGHFKQGYHNLLQQNGTKDSLDQELYNTHPHLKPKVDRRHIDESAFYAFNITKTFINHIKNNNQFNFRDFSATRLGRQIYSIEKLGIPLTLIIAHIAMKRYNIAVDIRPEIKGDSITDKLKSFRLIGKVAINRYRAQNHLKPDSNVTPTNLESIINMPAKVKLMAEEIIKDKVFTRKLIDEHLTDKHFLSLSDKALMARLKEYLYSDIGAPYQLSNRKDRQTEMSEVAALCEKNSVLHPVAFREQLGNFYKDFYQKGMLKDFYKLMEWQGEYKAILANIYCVSVYEAVFANLLTLLDITFKHDGKYGFGNRNFRYDFFLHNNDENYVEVWQFLPGFERNKNGEYELSYLDIRAKKERYFKEHELSLINVEAEPFFNKTLIDFANYCSKKLNQKFPHLGLLDETKIEQSTNSIEKNDFKKKKSRGVFKEFCKRNNVFIGPVDKFIECFTNVYSTANKKSMTALSHLTSEVTLKEMLRSIYLNYMQIIVRHKKENHIIQISKGEDWEQKLVEAIELKLDISTPKLKPSTPPSSGIWNLFVRSDTNQVTINIGGKQKSIPGNNFQNKLSLALKALFDKNGKIELTKSFVAEAKPTHDPKVYILNKWDKKVIDRVIEKIIQLGESPLIS